MKHNWMKWVKELQSIAQTGLNYTQNEFDRDRYQAVAKVAAEMLSAGSNLEQAEILNIFSDQVGHATPKVDVRGVVFKDDKILMVKEISDGGWTLPGGWADPNETPSQSVEREVFEESGYKVKAVRLLAAYDRDKQGHYPPHPFHVFKLFFLCDFLGGEKTLSIETEDVDFFERNKIPTLSQARVTNKQIERFFDLKENSNQPADFD